MSRLEFEDLPFDERPDLTPYLIHLTKRTKNQDGCYDAFENLVRILKTGKIWGSTSGSGFIKGTNSATCFMDVPFSALKYILNKKNADPQNPRYEPFGIIVTKQYAYGEGCRPVLYLSNKELSVIKLPKDELWRVVRLDVNDEGWISWLHEREWRCKGDFFLPYKLIAVLVKNTNYASRLQTILADKHVDFESLPKSIVPLTVICQGLPYL
ncbi:MAG: DUF2971 domain-containing protein [Pseudanabaena sp. M135S2SP2A07QC]|jgi:hypothetical protein|nr:DUF2971 domain-containing protein [Pseudanabaena sp. M110S1SP2A07QC]MCA6531335.1 DUF2971 domain-containing protein [Pseudanabaena sp. M125S2SP2A07QC]MCA6533944.1 DUF2971 domain-containing protein [Pseudanabaena sp. M176S2SP2A07QC]MCA6540479.1 DUF2971 domain-containing protein [Pseudanabaena sp. M037S2SP2A07QC]MCA6544186.1 DUF2971 domain-containing protein [Pseudanabaena sp. M074S1SP2A07QC]MCA6550225.1 DUF2971 domain-containing protein [Pseudanabaena sp. M152S2SP2A07QC]MCA6552425.1 DUF2971 